MLRCLLLEDGTAPSWLEDEALVVPPRAGARLWIDVETPTRGQLELLRERFDLHPVALEACAQVDQRPKLEEYQRQLFVVLHRLNVDEASGDVSSAELHAFLGDGYLITVHDTPLDELRIVRARMAGEPALAERSLVYCYYLVCERIAHSNFATLDRLFETVEAIEDSVLKQEDADALPSCSPPSGGWQRRGG